MKKEDIIKFIIILELNTYLHGVYAAESRLFVIIFLVSSNVGL